MSGSPSILDIRQSQTRTLQDQLNASAIEGMDLTLASINSEVTPPGRLIAQATPSLVVTVGSGTVVNPNTSKNRILPPLSNNVLNFLGGSITFPSTSGTIVNSNGSNASITIGANQFVAVLVEVNTSSQIVLTVGSAAGSLGAVVVPSSSSANLQLGYIVAESNGSSVIQNITNAMLYQFSGAGGAGGGSSNPWVANIVPIASGNSKTISFANQQLDTFYVVFAAMENLVDPFPQYQQVEVTNKTISGFTAKWNYPVDSANYSLVFIVVPKFSSFAEAAIGSGVTSITPSLFFPQSGSVYPLIATMQDLVDSSTQFQTALVSAQTSSNVTIKWNAPTDSANYQAVYALTATGSVSVGSGLTSVSAPLPVNYNTTNYVIIGYLYDSVDPFPQYQNVLITVKSGSHFTASWNAFTDSANYILVYYTISVSK